MSNTQDDRTKLAQCILRTRDRAKLEAVSEVLDGNAQPSFTAAEIAEMETIGQELVSGKVKGRPWAEVKNDLRKLMRA